jgi:hypothetical protein
MKKLLCAAAVMMCLVGPAFAAIDLRITEIWPGQAGDDITVDWFEITNYGDMPWVDGVDGLLRADDNSRSLANSALISGITNILPNESVIVLMEGSAAAEQTFYDAWNPVKSQHISNIGIAPGSGLGLGQGGGNPQDGVTLFLSGIEVDFETYTGSGLFNNGQSWDVVLAAYSLPGNASGAVASFALGGDDGDVPAIASPGMVSGVTFVPEPTSLAMMGLAALGMAARRQ